MNKRESVAVQLRRIAEDLTQVRRLYELEHSVDRLRRIADELEASNSRANGIQGHGTD
jgi:hypothetical protein